jgi:predicted patatin/cPLA2 family phospholipase
VHVHGESVVDGGLIDPIPAQEAYRRGARRIVVIRSRPAQAVKRDGSADVIAAALLRAQPAVAGAVRSTARRYREAVAFLHEPPADAKIVHIAPLRPLATGRTSQDVAALRRDYALGLSLAQRYEPQIRALLQEPAVSAHSSHAGSG